MRNEHNDMPRIEASEKKGALIGIVFVVCAVFAVMVYALQPPESSSITSETRVSSEARTGDTASDDRTTTNRQSNNRSNAPSNNQPDRQPSAKSNASSSGQPGHASTNMSNASTSKQASRQSSAKSGASSGGQPSRQSSTKSSVSSDGQPSRQSSTKSSASSGGQSNLQSAQKSSSPSAAISTSTSIKMTGKALKNIPTTQTLTVFSASKKQSPPSLAASKKRDIKRAITELKDAGYDCGFVFLDLTSGRGIARNAGKPFYTASAFKAALISFALQAGEELADYERSNVEASILYSDNDAYDSFAAAHIGQAYRDWLKSYDIDFDGTYYATTGAKSMARIWADMIQFLERKTDRATWFADLLSRTNRSFIRSALENTGVIIRNKAGWISDDDLCATTDCAYIDENGHPYLMVILTDQPDSDASNKRAGKIAKALFNVRKALLAS